MMSALRAAKLGAVLLQQLIAGDEKRRREAAAEEHDHDRQESVSVIDAERKILHKNSTNYAKLLLQK